MAHFVERCGVFQLVKGLLKNIWRSDSRVEIEGLANADAFDELVEHEVLHFSLALVMDSFPQVL